jgi:hypothetical protein
MGWLECISNLGIQGRGTEVERGIEGIIGIFFFHFSGTMGSASQMRWGGQCHKNRNLLILNWLFACAKITWKMGFFLRGYPRASCFALGVALSEQAPE